MEKIQAHTIQKVTLEIFTGSAESGHYMERTAADFFWEQIFPLLEKYLDGLAAQLENQTLEIPNLALEIFLDPTNLPDGPDLEADLRPGLEELRNELTPFLSSSGNPTQATAVLPAWPQGQTASAPLPFEKKGMRLRQDSEKLFEAWLFFLQTGQLPWWCERGSAAAAFVPSFLISNWLEFATNKDAFCSLLVEAPVREQLVTHYTGAELEQLMEAVSPAKFAILLKTFPQLFQANSLPERKARMALLVALFFHFNQREAARIAVLGSYLRGNAPDVRQRLENELSGSIGREKSSEQHQIWHTFLAEVKKVSGDTVQKQKALALDLDENRPSVSDRREDLQYVDRAGLILVHPFLPAFFSDCGFTDKAGTLVQPELAAKAIHYMVTREETPFDFELVFEKYLCAIPETTFLSRDLQVSDVVKNKTEKLLESVILHWRKLKNTGADTVRQEFLNRRGKLVIEESSDRVYVERKPQDVLLESLPWNLSLVKLPWRKKLLVVNW